MEKEQKTALPKDVCKTAYISDKLYYDITSGKLGCSGKRFLTVRELAAREDLSLVSAQKVVKGLSEKGAVTKFGSAYYLSYDRMAKGSDLEKQLLMSRSAKEKPIVGILISNMTNPFFSSILSRLSSALSDAGYFPLISNECSQKTVFRFISMGACGILTFSPIEKTGISPLVPVVNVFERESFGEHDLAAENDRRAASMVARHLTDEGYTSFLYIGESADPKHDNRFIGFSEELSRRTGKSIPPDEVLTDSPENSRQLSPLVGQKILEAAKPLGIFCFHDLIAERVISFCRRQHLDIPRDVGVAGFDDLPIAVQIKPTLTTVAYSYDKITKNALTRLFFQINRENGIPDIRENAVSYALVIRESSNRKKENEQL